MRQRARHAADAEPEDHLLERRDVAGLEPVLDELRDLVGGDGAGSDVLPDLARSLRRVAGAVGALELGQGIVGDVDEHDVHASLLPHARPPALLVFCGTLWSVASVTLYAISDLHLDECAEARLFDDAPQSRQ